jgi:hypothetical protein
VDNPRDSPEDVGELVVLDWDTKTIYKRVIVDSGNLVEEGRSRGASGITWHKEYIYVGGRSGVVKMNPDTYDYRVLDVKTPAGLHQIKSKGDRIYLAGTSENCLGIIEDDKLVDKVHLSSDPLHFNSIGWDSEGDQYHLYMGDRSSLRGTRKGPSRIVNYTTGREVARSLGRLPHDICFDKEDRLLYTSSMEGKVKFIHPKGGKKGVLFEKTVKGNPRGGYRMQGLLRGLAFHEGTNAVFVGSAPGSVHEIDADTGEELASVEFSNTLETAVYDILLDPRDWAHIKRAPKVIEVEEPIEIVAEVKVEAVEEVPEPVIEVVEVVEVEVEKVRFPRIRAWLRKRAEAREARKDKRQEKREERKKRKEEKKRKKGRGSQGGTS